MSDASEEGLHHATLKGTGREGKARPERGPERGSLLAQGEEGRKGLGRREGCYQGERLQSPGIRHRLVCWAQARVVAG